MPDRLKLSWEKLHEAESVYGSEFFLLLNTDLILINNSKQLTADSFMKSRKIYHVDNVTLFCLLEFNNIAVGSGNRAVLHALRKGIRKQSYFRNIFNFFLFKSNHIAQLED